MTRIKYPEFGSRSERQVVRTDFIKAAEREEFPIGALSCDYKINQYIAK
jgi:hypothetical protein